MTQSSTLKTSVITTINHNVGDDFVREGILHLLEQTVKIGPIELIHKHLPVTCRPELDWYYNRGVADRLERIKGGMAYKGSQLLDRLPLNPRTDRVLTADLLVQSGGPVYWVSSSGYGCHHSEWWGPLIEKRWSKRTTPGLFLSLAGGTCQSYYSDGSEFSRSAEVLDFVARFYDATQLTTVRDKLSLSVLAAAGRRGILLPCTSIFAVDRLGVRARAGRYIVLNYMHGGGHFDFNNDIDARKWEKTFIDAAKALMKEEECVLVCHNRKERDLAEQILPGCRYFYSRDFREYLELYSEAKCGLLNRVHGAFALASMGKPSVVVGADSRARMAEELGLQAHFVNEVSAAQLITATLDLRDRTGEFEKRMATLKQEARAQYLHQIAVPVMGRRTGR